MKSKINIVVLSGILFTLILSFSWWSHPSLIPKTSPDSWGYINLAEDINHEISEIRPFFFPLLIKSCMSLSEMYWKQIFSILQILFHAFISIILFFLYLKFGFKKSTSFILTLIIGFNPSLVYYTTYVLTDHLHAVLTTLAWLSSIIFIQKYNKNRKNNVYLILIGIFSGLAIVTKPISILVIVPLLFTYIIVSKKSLKMIINIILILLINYSFHLGWENYKIRNSNNTKLGISNSTDLSSLNDEHYFISPWWFDNQLIASINLTAIRGGLIDFGKGTPLYNDIKEKKLLQSARSLNIKLSYTSDDDPTYHRIRKQISRYVANDKKFAKNIIDQAPYRLFFYQISNWHSFFTKRYFGPGEGSFPYMPEVIRYCYVVGYSLLYRPLLILLLLSSFIILWKRRLYTLLFSSGGILLYASLSIALLTPHGGEFPRYRVWIEYIMFFCALLPIGIIMEFCCSKLNSKFWQISTKPINIIS